MSSSQFAWMMYLLGSVGCGLVAWWMFSRAWRFVRYSAVATVLIILLLPFSIDKQETILAPAIFTLVFEGMAQGKAAVEHPLKLMLSMWALAEIIIGLFVFFTRNAYAQKRQAELDAASDQSHTESHQQDSQTQEGRQGFEPKVHEVLVHQEDLEHAEQDHEFSDSKKLADDAQQMASEEKPKTRKRPSVKPKAAVAESEESVAPKSAAQTKTKKTTTTRKEEPIRAIRD